MKGAFNWLLRKEQKDNLNYIEVTIEELYSNHHYMKKVFGGIVLDIDGLSLDDINTTLSRFSKDYKFLIRVPDYMFIPGDGESFVSSFEFIDEVLNYSSTIKGLILKVGRHKQGYKKVLKHLETVIFGRLLVKLDRLGVGLYIENGIVPYNSDGLTLSDLLRIKKVYPKVRLFLNLYNSVRSGQSFIRANETNNGLGGLVKNFDGLCMIGINHEQDPIVPLASGDEFSLSNYRKLIKQFPNRLFIYKGNFDLIYDFINRINAAN